MKQYYIETTGSTRASAIAERLEAVIIDGHLQPGDKVPSERQLCQRFNTSRASVREAIKILRGRGVISTEQGRGSFVSALVEEVNDQSPLTKLYNNHPHMLFDLLDVRELLEGHATLLAAERGTEKDFYKIKKAFNAMNTTPENKDELLEIARLDHEFHKSIYEASHNPVLIHTLQSLMQLMRSSVETSIKRLYLRARPKKIIDDDHKAIFTHIMDREPEKAQLAAIKHVRNVNLLLQEMEREEKRDSRAIEWRAVK